MSTKPSNVVLNFKMSGQVEYAKTVREINSIMNVAAKEYKNHVAAMGEDAKATDKLRAEKKKLEVQMDAAKKRTEMLRAQYDAMSSSTKTTTGQLTQMYGKLLDAENAERSLEKSMNRVNEGLTDQAIGSREAKDQLESLKNEAQQLEAEQKELTSSFKLQNAELGENATEAEKVELAQKQLKSQMEVTDRAVANLERQLEATKKVYGENSVEVRQLSTRLNEAKSNVAEFKTSLDKLEDSGKKSKKSLEGVGSGLQGLAGALPAAAVGGLVSSMQELNRGLARLETNALNTGFNLGVIEEGFKKIAAVSGETDSAVETMANLMATDFNEAQLAKVIDEINGAAIRFSDTLKTEGIADGLQETFATGQAMGQFGELLERSGVDLDEFNQRLGMAKLVGNETNFVLQQLSELGLSSAYEEYKNLNPELMAHEQATMDQQMALAELSITLTPLITKVAEFTTKIIEWANENPKLTKGIVIGTTVIGGLITTLTLLGPIIFGIKASIPILGAVFTALTGPVGLVIAAIAGLIAIGVLLYKNWDTVKEKTGELKDSVVNKISELKDKAITNFNSLRDKAGEVMQQAKNKILEPIETAKTKISGIIEDINGFFSGMKLEIPKIKLPNLPRFSIKGDFSLNPPSVPKLSIDWFAKGGIFTRPTIFGVDSNGRYKAGGEAGPEAALPLNEETLGAIGRGIADSMGSLNGQVVVPVYLDGIEIARVTYPYIDSMQANSYSSNMRYKGLK